MSNYLISTNPRERLIDRELSWLAFNERVLELAEDVSNPLLERCRFLAIFSSNLYYFFYDLFCTKQAKLKNYDYILLLLCYPNILEFLLNYSRKFVLYNKEFLK